MEPEFYCRITCEASVTHLIREDVIYDVFIIDGDYYITDQQNNQSEVFKSCYHDNMWRTVDGKSAYFLECR